MSCGPGLASGWPWKQKAGRSVRARPWIEPSKSDTWVTRRFAGSESGSTEKPWFWLVISTWPVSRSLTGMVRAVMPELHLGCAAAAGEPHDLVAEADAESRQAALDQRAGRLDRIVAGLRIARAVGQEDAVRIVGQRLLGRCGGGQHRQLAAAVRQQPQNVPLDAVVERDHPIGARRRHARSRFRRHRGGPRPAARCRPSTGTAT